MHTIRFKPTWREGAKTVSVVVDPDRKWFDSCEFGARFSLMSDGTMWWGDASHVLHQDMCGFRIDSKERATKLSPIFVGCLILCRNHWRIGTIQWWMNGDEGVVAARDLLQRLSTWKDICNELEEDPCDKGPLEWDNG